MDKGDSGYKSSFWRESVDSDFENSASSIKGSPFRGFEKQPKVVIEKLNIESLLNKANLKSNKFRRKSQDTLQDTIQTLPQLTASCFVKLAREDLQQLKKDVLENSRLKKVKTKGILIMPSLQCKICEKIYTNEKKLQNHVENKHMLVYKADVTRKPKHVSFSDHIIVHEVKEYHRCRKCTKIFEDYKCLKSHMKQQHRKRKCYICNYCTKKFVDRMFFKVHIKHHCDVCGLLFPNKSKYLMHRRDSCRVIKKYTCKTCLNKFFSYMNLKDHSYDHLEDLFVCDICKAQHSSKCAILHHILFLHSKKRPKELVTNRNLGNERLYLCNFCEVSSLDKNDIDKHVSILPDLSNRKCTGYKDYYFCDQCLRKFDTETSMLQHKWSHFLNNSDTSQAQTNKKVKGEAEAKLQRTFNIHKALPYLIQPKVVLERIMFRKPINVLSVIDSKNVNVLLDEKIEDQKKNDVEIIKETSVSKSIEDVDLIVDQNGIVSTEPKDQNQVQATLTNAKSISDVTTEMEIGSNEKEGVNVTNHGEISVVVKKAIIDPKSKKTLISRFQCEKCHKFYSSNYCLNRHIMAVHTPKVNLQCNICEESFVWPSLLKTHKCIRMNIPEMPFDDARPEIQFDNYGNFGQPGIDDLMNISENEDYMNSVDFEIPAPIVQTMNSNGSHVTQQLMGAYRIPVHNSYKIVMQEVPIEF